MINFVGLTLILLATVTQLCYALPKAEAKQNYQLIFSHVLYRHGDRSPSKSYPNDPYKADAWPMGWAQLTKLGIQQTNELGRYMRKRYSSFLNPVYNRDEIYVRSTDKDRTLMSAQSVLSGLYPATASGSCNNPIPVHTVPEEEDLLLESDAGCPAYDRVLKEQNEAIIAAYDKQYKPFYDFLKEKTGLKEVNLDKVETIYGALFREKAQGWKMPEWVDSKWNNTKETVYEVILRLKQVSKAMYFNSIEKSSRSSGFLLGDMINRMQEKIKGNLEIGKKMMMYSAHDGTVFGLSYALNISNHQVPPYASCIFVELYKAVEGKENNSDDSSSSNSAGSSSSDDSDEKHGHHRQLLSVPDYNGYYVAVFFRNDTSVDPRPMTATGCPVNTPYCPLSTFVEAHQPVVLYPEAKRVEACK